MVDGGNVREGERENRVKKVKREGGLEEKEEVKGVMEEGRDRVMEGGR